MVEQPLILSPIYLTVLLSTVFAVISGLIFKDMLEYWVDRWSENPTTDLYYKTPDLVLAYIATTVLITLSVASSLVVFVPSYWIAGTLGVLVVMPTAFLIWVQLGSMLKLLETRGLEAVDLDLVINPPVQDIQPQSLVNKG
ncbi:MAG: hypothetical protein ACRC8A_18805 [Microcoleaceae cyanobacterium]